MMLAQLRYNFATVGPAMLTTVENSTTMAMVSDVMMGIIAIATLVFLETGHYRCRIV